jgi:hypothetical protein
MHVEVFCFCDSASLDRAGRLVLRGVHNENGFGSFPAMIPPLTVAGRVRFGFAELGSHWFALHVRQHDGCLVWAQADQEIEVERTNDDHIYAWNSFMITITGLPLAGPMTLLFDLVLDGVPVSSLVYIAVAEPAVAPAVSRRRT